MSKKQSFEEQMSMNFFDLLKEVDIRGAENGKLVPVKMPPTLRTIMDNDIAEIEKAIGIKINFATYILLCVMLVSRYGQNPKKEFYRKKNVPSLVDFAKSNEKDLKVLWASIVLQDRRGSR